MTCPLCNLDRDTCIVLDGGLILIECDTCKIPMLVADTHISEFTEDQKIRVVVVAHKRWPRKSVRWTKRKILDHAHAHVETE